MSYKTIIDRARITDRDKLTVNQRFCQSDFVTVISSQSEGLGKMALGKVKYVFDRSSQLIGVIWFAVSLFDVRGQFVVASCRGPNVTAGNLLMQ